MRLRPAGCAVWPVGNAFLPLSPVCPMGMQSLLPQLFWFGAPRLTRREGAPPELQALPPTSCTHYLELEVQFSLEVVLLTLDGHFAAQLHGHGAIQDP